jgi:N,N'-diacetyllegionaminate synthase
VVPFLDSLFPVIKIASGDINFEPVIRASAQSGNPVIISTDLATEAEIMTAIGWFQDAAGGGELRDRLVIMHCVSAYGRRRRPFERPYAVAYRRAAVARAHGR